MISLSICVTRARIVVEKPLGKLLRGLLSVFTGGVVAFGVTACGNDGFDTDASYVPKRQAELVLYQNLTGDTQLAHVNAAGQVSLLFAGDPPVAFDRQAPDRKDAAYENWDVQWADGRYGQLVAQTGTSRMSGQRPGFPGRAQGLLADTDQLEVVPTTSPDGIWLQNRRDDEPIFLEGLSPIVDIAYHQGKLFVLTTTEALVLEERSGAIRTRHSLPANEQPLFMRLNIQKDALLFSQLPDSSWVSRTLRFTTETINDPVATTARQVFYHRSYRNLYGQPYVASIRQDTAGRLQVEASSADAVTLPANTSRLVGYDDWAPAAYVLQGDSLLAHDLVTGAQRLLLTGVGAVQQVDALYAASADLD